jgi:murein DD-endopeptidase MepM/ murein hydrolase activator NlpD
MKDTVSTVLKVCLLLLCVMSLVIPAWSQVVSTLESETPDVLPEVTLLPRAQIKQGGILHVQVKPVQKPTTDLVANFDGHPVKLFEQPSGVYEGLVGISVFVKPGTHNLHIMTTTGTDLAVKPFYVIDGKFPRQNIRISSSKEELQPLPGEMEAVQALKSNVTPVRYWEKPLMSPTPDCENSPFGVKRYHNGVFTDDYHRGVDLRAPHGRPIQAISDGVVKISAPKFRLHGGTVGLDHGQGLNSIYIHMSRVAVKPGQQVKKGDIIGYVGSTGFASGPHLHWGLFANGIPVNPDLWIPVRRCS